MRSSFFLLPLLFLFFSLTASSVLAQETGKISGYVRAADGNDVLPGATVAVPVLGLGANTDSKGFYTLTLPVGSHTLQVTFVGYQTATRTIRVTTKNQTISFSLEPASSQLQEVVVEANTLKQKFNSTQMSVDVLTSREAKLLPALFGEVDLIKTLQLKPGVQSGGEGSSGLYVRGGGPDQNLVLLDDAIIYNASHLFGFFSVFNPDAVHQVELYKGGFPAQFGGKLSSVVDVTQREGNNEKIQATGGLGLISSRLTLDGPIVKDKATFLISGRRTYFDVFTRQINRLNEDNKDYSPIPDYYFYDLNAKLNYRLSNTDELSFSGYFGRDFFTFKDAGFSAGFNWGNKMGALSWRRKLSPNLFATTTLSGTGYQYTLSNNIDVFTFRLTSEINDIGLKTDFDLLLDGGHSIKFGAMGTRHHFTIGNLNFNSQDNSLAIEAGSTYEATEFGLYAGDDFEVNPQLSVNYGLRFSGFSSGGKTYTGLEPRLSAKYKLSESLSLKGSYASMRQYIHLATNSGATLPTDVWYPSNQFVAPQRSQQAALGISKLLGDGKFLLTNELYYKWMHNQIDFRDGANLFVNDNLEQDFLFGVGRSYGNEIYFEKIKGRTTGWIGYTLSWTFRKFDGRNGQEDINDGNWFPTRYDRRHDLSIVLLHKLKERLSLTGAFVYGSGNAFSLPLARFPFQDVEGRDIEVVPVYYDRNSFRMAAYHRLDLGLVWKLQPKRGESDLTFSVYNAYNRRNPYFVYFDQVDDEQLQVPVSFKAKQVSLFPVIPSVTYNFKF